MTLGDWFGVIAIFGTIWAVIVLVYDIRKKRRKEFTDIADVYAKQEPSPLQVALMQSEWGKQQHYETMTQTTYSDGTVHYSRPKPI